MTAPVTFPFDAPQALEITRARQDFIREFLTALQSQVSLQTALDVGCGIGYFSGFLAQFGLSVTGIEGREENVAEARRRFPAIPFRVHDVELPPPAGLPPADLVLCTGLLYHLENPFRVIRNLHTLTSKLLILEGMCIPGSTAAMELLDEGTLQDQGLNFVAFYPTELCLVKMLYRSGFPFVYLFRRLPGHPQFQQSIGRQRQRTMMVASRVSLNTTNLVLAPEPARQVMGLSDPWTTPFMKARYFLGNLRRSFWKS